MKIEQFTHFYKHQKLILPRQAFLFKGENGEIDTDAFFDNKMKINESILFKQRGLDFTWIPISLIFELIF